MIDVCNAGECEGITLRGGTYGDEILCTWGGVVSVCGGNGLYLDLALEPILRPPKSIRNKRLSAPIKNALVTLHR